MIVRMTSSLSDEAARQVEAAVLGRAGLADSRPAARGAAQGRHQGRSRRRRATSPPGRTRGHRRALSRGRGDRDAGWVLAAWRRGGRGDGADHGAGRLMKAGVPPARSTWLRAHVFLGLLLGTFPMTPPAMHRGATA